LSGEGRFVSRGGHCARKTEAAARAGDRARRGAPATSLKTEKRDRRVGKERRRLVLSGPDAGVRAERYCSIVAVSSINRPSGLWKKPCTFAREMLR
jgi:hypothetical protein